MGDARRFQLAKSLLNQGSIVLPCNENNTFTLSIFIPDLILIFLCCGFFMVVGCSEKVKLSNRPSQQVEETAILKNERISNPAYRTQAEQVSPTGQNVGVFYMPSWDVSSGGGEGKDIFWACLQGNKDCPFLTNTSIWGPKGRIFNQAHPYTGPFLDKKPHKTLKGFYDRQDTEVIKKQLEYMKSYGIDFIAYNWFFGRHYYYHKNFAPQAKVFYPKDWPLDLSRDGRVEVPGVEEWTEQLHVILEVNGQLPKDNQIKFAINWVDDGNDRWMNWLQLGSPQNIKTKVNYKGESPSKELYLQVHDKITLLWIEKYFKRDDYLKDADGRPIVYFYFPHDTESRAAFYKVTLKELLDRSKSLAQKAGFKGIKFIAVTSGSMQPNELPYAMPTNWKAKDPNRPWLGGTYDQKMLFQDYVPRLKGMGFEGLTAYIYHSYFGQYNRSYQDMRKTYDKHWDTWSRYFQKDPDFEYQVPVAMGWNMKPMGGTWPQLTGFPSEPQKDGVISNKKTFKEKLLEAKKYSDQYKSTNGNTVMICCWNEYLEGNHIEPTVGHGFDYLEAIKEVFPD